MPVALELNLLFLKDRLKTLAGPVQSLSLLLPLLSISLARFRSLSHVEGPLPGYIDPGAP